MAKGQRDLSGGLRHSRATAFAAGALSAEKSGDGRAVLGFGRWPPKALEVHTLLKELTEPEDDVRIYQIQGGMPCGWRVATPNPAVKPRAKANCPVWALFSKLIAKLGA